MPKISIVMPVFNAANCLCACLDSVLAQTLREFEVICIDDGSTDGSLEILREYERGVQVKSPGSGGGGPDFRVISCEHTNAGHCRNVGIAESRGEYLLFLDADDLFAPELLETLYTAATATKADMAICGHIRFNDGDDIKGLFAQTKTVAPQVYRNPSKDVDIYHWQGWPWDKLIARRLVDRYALFFQEQRTTNDVFFMMSALSVAETIVECPIPLVAYRLRTDSLTETRHKSPRCFYDALVGYYDKMCALGVFPDNENLLENFRVYSCDQSLWQFDSVPGADAAEIIFPLLKELRVRWHWCEALEREGNHPLLSQRCQSLALSENAAEWRRRDILSLLKCQCELEAIKRSHTYRFAQMLVRWIRRLSM